MRSTRSLNPRISRPISASHEPGVSGVSNASTPTRTNTTPRTILSALRIFSGKERVKTLNPHFCHAEPFTSFEDRLREASGIIMNN